MKIFTLSCLLLVSAIVSAQTLRLSEPVSKDNNSETFGAVLNTSLSKTSITELATKPSEHIGEEFQLQTRIAKVCQKKGCFFIAQENEHVLRVSFLDYGFFLPTDSSGKTVTLAGKLVQKELSKEQADHFKADLQSEDGVVKAGTVYEIVASSVKVPLS